MARWTDGAEEALEALGCTQSTPRYGERYTKDTGVWKVCGIGEDCVSLTGPGPGRSVLKVPFNEFFSEWKRV